mmetsp:Transcript_40788/g.85681  ORF Transcript_40788/g.85681 Transcript_40788/m.85681 type:complete len:271 (-) Transcript_40788:301-1113(-)
MFPYVSCCLKNIATIATQLFFITTNHLLEAQTVLTQLIIPIRLIGNHQCRLDCCRRRCGPATSTQTLVLNNGGVSLCFPINGLLQFPLPSHHCIIIICTIKTQSTATPAPCVKSFHPSTGRLRILIKRHTGRDSHPSNPFLRRQKRFIVQSQRELGRRHLRIPKGKDLRDLLQTFRTLFRGHRWIDILGQVQFQQLGEDEEHIRANLVNVVACFFVFEEAIETIAAFVGAVFFVVVACSIGGSGAVGSVFGCTFGDCFCCFFIWRLCICK